MIGVPSPKFQSMELEAKLTAWMATSWSTRGAAGVRAGTAGFLIGASLSCAGIVFQAILRNPLARAEGKNKAAQERFTALLDEIPPSTALVLVVEDYMDRGDWKLMPVNKPHWLREWLGKAGKRALLRECPLPPVGAMSGWISKQAEGMGGRFTPSAAQALAALVGNETQVALQEIRKLLEYANYQRPVEQEDVELLTAVTAQASIFEMVDALAEGNASKAQRLLQVLMEMDREGVFGMVVRQFRLLNCNFAF